MWYGSVTISTPEKYKGQIEQVSTHNGTQRVNFRLVMSGQQVAQFRRISPQKLTKGETYEIESIFGVDTSVLMPGSIWIHLFLKSNRVRFNFFHLCFRVGRCRRNWRFWRIRVLWKSVISNGFNATVLNVNCQLFKEEFLQNIQQKRLKKASRIFTWHFDRSANKIMRREIGVFSQMYNVRR